MTVLEVWLIRHGESKANVGEVTLEPSTIPLTPTGVRQAAEIAHVFDQAPDLIVTSPFRRAQQTAQPTIDRFPAVATDVWPIEEFTYLARLHGRPTTAAEREPLVRAFWQAADPSYVDDERSESFADVYGRARQFVKRLSGLSGFVAAFTHGLFMRFVLWAIMTGEDEPDAGSMRRFYQFRTSYLVPNAAIIALRFDADGGVRIVGGSTDHLPSALRTGGV